MRLTKGNHQLRALGLSMGCAILFGSLAYGYAPAGMRIASLPQSQDVRQQTPTNDEETDSVYHSRYPVAPTTPDMAPDLEKAHPGDLKTPENVKTVVEYDWKNNRYLIKTMLGEQLIGNPIPMTMQEYSKYTERQQRSAYFLDQYHKAVEEEEGKGEFDLLDMQFSRLGIPFDGHEA